MVRDFLILRIVILVLFLTKKSDYCYFFFMSRTTESVLMPLSGSTSTNLLVDIFFILGLVLIRLDLRFCL